MTNRPVLIAAGGTGGHVFPALAVASALRDKNVPVVWVGTQRGIESRLVPEWDFPIRTIQVTALRGNGLLTRLQSLWNLLSALLRSCKIVFKERPRTVLGMGGYVAGPVCLSARLCGRRMVLHEQNAVAGLTNKVLRRFANQVMEAMPNTFPAAQRAVYTGNPVREDILVVAPPVVRMKDRSGIVRLLVIGGSQGARALNEVVPESLNKVSTPLSVRHQAGAKDQPRTESLYSKSSHEVRVTAFIDDMAEAYGWADLIICRSGAMTVAEVAAVGLAAILVPYPSAVDDHQTANGRFLVDTGAALMVQESALTAESLCSQISALVSDRSGLLAMAQKGREVSKRNATELVVNEILGEAT